MGATDGFGKTEAALLNQVDEANLDDAQREMLLQ